MPLNIISIGLQALMFGFQLLSLNFHFQPFKFLTFLLKPLTFFHEIFEGTLPSEGNLLGIDAILGSPDSLLIKKNCPPSSPTP